ncbi:MAG: hypothetical protein RCO49_02310 [Rickettsia endosymbiont of Argas persicus]
MKLSNKGNKNQLEILPVIDSINGARDILLFSEFRKDQELRALKIKVDSIPDWFLEHKSITNVYLNNLIEIIKLSIECNAPCEVGDNEIEEIMSESSIEYEKTHKSILDQVSRVSIGEQAGTSSILKRKGIGSDAPAKKVKFNLENLEEHRDNIGLQASGSSCSTRPSSKKRLKRDLCQEKETEEIFPYEPLEEGMVAEHSKINARLYSQIAYLVALEQLESTNPNIKPDSIFTYMANIGDIISEGEINHSLREQELLQTHYQAAQDFCNTYPKDTVLELVGAEIDSSSRAWLFDNGKHSLLVSYDGHRYHIYSQDLNYRQSFQTKEGVRFTDIELYAEAFFKWRSDSIEYDLFALKSNVPEEITTRIKQAKFWHPDEVVSDLVLLDKGFFSNIEGIPAKVVRELFFLDSKVPALTALHENFFVKYFGRISIRVEELHHVLSLLTPQASKSLVNLVKQHNFRVDTAYLNNMPESTQSLLHSYHNKISDKFKTSESITIQELSGLSWQIIADKMLEHPEISSELRESSLQSVKELHSVAATRAHALGITSQTLFFLPDIIRSMNTGNFEGLQKNAEMMLGDMAFNKMYDSLISKLGSVLPESRIALLKKLPLTSPIFKILTVHSIIELHKQLNNLPADSEEAGIIKHQLGEQYFTIGLMVAELFGLELGPLWIGLMAEQLVYGAIALRKQYHLDIPFGEAFLMNLGFEQDKLQSILTERQLADLNLSLVNRLSAQTNTSYGLVVVKVPKMSYDEAHSGNSVIEFKPKDSSFCMEDNVFLEKNSGYQRISSVISDEQNNNCVDAAPLQISGDGLTALYGNSNSTEKQSIYVNFDPNEGDMKLHFTKEGLTRLDKLNNHQQNNSSVTNLYVVTTQIHHKPYPDQIGLFGNRNHRFVLSDDSKRVASNYYIDGTSSFVLEDNSRSTSIKFLNRKLFKGYNAYISGNTSNMQIKSIYSEDTVTGHIILKNKDYLKLNLEHLLINGTLTIDIPNVEILYAKGDIVLSYNHHLYNGYTIEVSTNVLTFKILLEAPSISRIDIKNNNAPDVVIDMGHLNNRPFTISLQAIHTEYKSYYTFTVDDLQPVLDEMTFTSRGFPEHFLFLCSSRVSIKGQCIITNNDPMKNIISIKGKIDKSDGMLMIEDKKSILKIVKNITEAPKNEHTEIVNYGSIVKYEDDLRFDQVLKRSNYNISVYYNYISKHNLTNWSILKFYSSNGRTILHHFKYDDIQINDINYFIKESKIYAVLGGTIDGNKLLKYDEKRTVAVLIAKSLKDSLISVEGEKIIINNATLYHLPDKTSLIFQESNNKTLSVSFKLLKDSIKFNSGPPFVYYNRYNTNITINSEDVEENTEVRFVEHLIKNHFCQTDNHHSSITILLKSSDNLADNIVHIITLPRFYQEPKMQTLSIVFIDPVKCGPLHVPFSKPLPLQPQTINKIKLDNIGDTLPSCSLSYNEPYWLPGYHRMRRKECLLKYEEQMLHDIDVKLEKLRDLTVSAVKYLFERRSTLNFWYIYGPIILERVIEHDKNGAITTLMYLVARHYFKSVIHNPSEMHENLLIKISKSFGVEQIMIRDLIIAINKGEDDFHQFVNNHQQKLQNILQNAIDHLDHLHRVRREADSGQEVEVIEEQSKNLHSEKQNLYIAGIASSATKTPSLINDGIKWLKDKLLSSNDYNDDHYQTNSTITTVSNVFDINGGLHLLTLLAGQLFGTNKTLSHNNYSSPQQIRADKIGQLEQKVNIALRIMHALYGNSEQPEQHQNNWSEEDNSTLSALLGETT